VNKKQERCDPDDQHGDWWDHVALDPETRSVRAVVPGARGAEAVEEVVGEVTGRTGGRVLDLATSDDDPAYETALLHAYGQEVATPATGRPAREMGVTRRPLSWISLSDRGLEQEDVTVGASLMQNIG
jgi:hypothetical protein